MISLGGNSESEELELQIPRKKQQVDIDSLVQRYKVERRANGDSDSDEDGERKPALPFVDWLAFHVFMALLVVADAVVMGLGVDAPEQQRNLLYVLEVILCLIFLCEICLRGFFVSSRVFSAV